MACFGSAPLSLCVTCWSACSGNQLFTPDVKPGRSNLKLTACAPLFFHSYRIRDAGPCPLPCLLRSIGVKREVCGASDDNLFELRDTL